MHPSQTTPSSKQVDYPRIGLISLGHFTNDMYGNMMTSLTPYLVIRGAISVTMAGFVLLIYLIGSSVFQPIFGLMSDRTGRRFFVVLGPIWLGTAASLFGWAGNSVTLLALAAFGGIGTAAFHPQAASIVNGLSRRSKGWSMSLFSTGGNIGFAFGPIAAAVVAAVGLHWSLAALIPGIGMTILLALFVPAPTRETQDAPKSSLWGAARGRWKPLSLIVGVIAVRSGAQYAMIIFLPLYFHVQGYAPQLGSYLAFALSLAGAAGGLLGGHLSDRYGRRLVVVSTLLLSAPLLLVSLVVPVLFVWPVLAIAGALLLASNSVTVVQGQELLPANTGIAAGLTMGLGFGLTGIITSALAAFSDHAGVTAAIFVVPFLALLAAGLGALIPDAGTRSSSLQTVIASQAGATGSGR